MTHVATVLRAVTIFEAVLSTATLGSGGEFGGIGSATHIWTWTARGRIPF